MPSAARIGFVVVAAFAALAGCSSDAQGPQACADDARCPAGARCVAGACVANAPPSAEVALPSAALETSVLLSFDASASADPDPGDSIASFAWTFRHLSGACEPPTVSGAEPVATLRFACPGRYAVDVTATDEMGATSTASEEFEVVAYAGPALLAVADDVSTDHSCSGAPPLCSLSAPVSLAASTPGVEGASYLWTVEPPAGRALEPGRRVLFSPGADVASPQVAIETDGLAISGDWIFRVVARDAAGVIGTAATRVSVRNRPPSLVVPAVSAADHVFDGSQLLAEGAVGFSVEDPDGDPLLAPEVEWRHAGDGSSTFIGAVLGGPPRVAYSIVVPYDGPQAASRLIAPEGLERSIGFSISDVNGASASDSWSIVVGNRPPVSVSAPGFLAVHHGYDRAGARYFADASVGTWADPDNDPLLPGMPTGSDVCSSYDILAGSAVVRCSAPYPGAPRLGGIVGMWNVWTGVTDPWASSSGKLTTIQVLNRAPRMARTAASAPAVCAEGGCCRSNADGECTGWWQTMYASTESISGVFADDDGDPLSVVVNGSPSVCDGSSCVVSGTLPDGGMRCGTLSVTNTWTVTASDSLDSASGTLTITRSCP